MAKNTKPAKNTKSKSDDFIGEDALSSGSASYMKLQDGENQFRILSAPVAGWIDWVEKRPVRTTLADGEPEAADDENPPKKFIAMVVIDRADDEVKILELTQQSVIKAIRTLSQNDDWGKPFSYDINVTKSGSGLKTKYATTPSPKKPLSKELIKAANAKPCNLEALFTGEDPWEIEDEQTEYFYK